MITSLLKDAERVPGRVGAGACRLCPLNVETPNLMTSPIRRFQVEE